MHVLEVQADNIGEQTLGQTVLTHHLDGLLATLVGQLQVAVGLNGEQSVLLHASHRLGNGRAGVLQTLGDARTHGDDAFFLQFENSAQVHLCGVDKVSHYLSSHQHDSA